MYDELKLDNQLCFPIYLCCKEIIKKYSFYLDEIDLTYTQYIVMMYLWEKRKSSLRDIGKKLLLESSTLTPLVKRLELKGYLIREKDLDDSRNLIIRITDKGLNLRSKALNIPSCIGDSINLSDEDALALYDILYKILRNMEVINYD